MRISINYGEITVKNDVLKIGTSTFSRIMGSILLIVGIGLLVAINQIGLNNDQWLQLLKTTWFLFGLILYMGFRFIGAWSDSMVLNGETNTITLTKHWLFVPIKKTIHKFSEVKEIVGSMVVPRRKLGIEGHTSHVWLMLDDKKWITIARLTYQDKENVIKISEKIMEETKRVIGVRVRNELRKEVDG